MQGPAKKQQLQKIQVRQEQQQLQTSNIDRIVINKQKHKIQIQNARQDLTYFLISTQPGRKIYYPPLCESDLLQFSYHKCDGISLQSEGYCAIGYNRALDQRLQYIIKKPPSSVIQKVVCISKISINYKINSKTYYLNQNQKYSFTVNTQPPQDITAAQIQQFLLKVVQNYGQVVKVDVKRNCLMLFFNENVIIKQNFIIKGLEKGQRDLVLTYWATTSHRTSFTYQPISLIQLPVSSKVGSFIIHCQWLILSTQNNVIFLHLYKPTQNFLNLDDIKIQGIYPMDSQKIILFQYKFLHIYKLSHNKNPQLLGVSKVKKMQPFTVAFRKKTALFAGINYSNILNEPVQQKQIFVIQNFTTSKFTNKSFLADKKLSICKKGQNIPMKNLKHLQKSDLFICTCGQSIYLFHQQSSSLIASVDLLSSVHKLFEIDYPINLINCLATAQDYKNIIRVSFQQYGQIVGAQVSNIQKYGNIVDFHAQGKQVYCLDGDNLMIYGASDKSRVVYSCENEQQKMNKITVYKQFLAFLLQKKNIFQVYFMEL